MHLNDINDDFIAGFDLAGYRQPDGSLISNWGISMPKIPDEITYGRNTYTLEETQEGTTDPEKGQWVNLIYA